MRRAAALGAAWLCVTVVTSPASSAIGASSVPAAVQARVASPSARAGADTPAPRFTDTGRRRALESAWPEIERLLRQHQETMRAPGLSWGVVIDGELVRAGGLGVRRAGSADLVTPDTVFRIASMTKSATALAILKLRDAGRLSLEDPVTRFVPELSALRLPTADSPAITIRHLLTHSEGFPEDNPWGDRVLDAPEEVFSTWMRSGIPFSNTPGTAYEYSNYGFAILGRIVARASARGYRAFVDDEILGPLGMGSTWWDPRDVPPARLASGHRWIDGAWRDEPLLHDGAFGAMGGLLVSGRDLARYVGFMLSAWPPSDQPDAGPVRRPSLREMQQAWRSGGLSASVLDGGLRASATAYGYGLRVSQDCVFRHVAGHSGGLPGFGSNMTWLPEHGVGVYVMANVTYAPAASAARAVIDRLAATGGLRPRELPPSRALETARQAVTRIVEDWDDGELRRIAAVNLLLDEDASTRREHVASLRAKVGRCEPGGWLAIENWLRGRFRLTCERGALAVTMTLAPTSPPAVQYLRVVEAPASPAIEAGPCR